MKLLILVIALITFASARKYPDYLPVELVKVIETLHHTCMPKHGVTIEDVSNYESYNKDPKMMCYMQCMLLEAHWMKSNLEMNYDFIIKTAHPEIKELLTNAVNKCRDIPAATTECELAYNFQTCLSEADPKHWFLP